MAARVKPAKRERPAAQAGADARGLASKGEVRDSSPRRLRGADEPTLTAQLVETLTDVGTVVNMLSLYERMEALREAAGLEPSPLPSNNARS
jgi:hypothetical protein